MIGGRQIPYKHPIGGGGESPIVAIFQQLWQPIFNGSILPPFVVFGPGSLSKCIGYASAGSFTAEIYIDEVLKFTVTQADNPTPIIGGGVLLNPSLVKCKVVSASPDLQGLYVLAY